MRSNQKLVYAGIAVALILAGAIGYAIWRDSQTNTMEINIGDETLRIETDGR
jgi:thiosulfate reductase cytochrome b subunit